MKFSLLSITTTTFSLGIMSIVQAGTIVIPESISTDIPESFSVTNIINQSGLSIGYTEGDDFDLYLSGNPTHLSEEGTDFLSESGETTGAITFDFGTAKLLESIAFWNFAFPEVIDYAVTSFSLEASLTSDFSDSINLGTFSPTVPSNNPTTADVFSEGVVNAQFIRLNILNNDGGSNVGIGEVLFEEFEPMQSTPEPTSLLGLFLIGSAGLLAKKKQK